MSMESDDIFWERLRGIAEALPEWLKINREALMAQIIRSVLNCFRAQPSPEQIEGIETGLDFLGLLLYEGGDNALCEVTMEQLDREIYRAVAHLSDDEQIVILLPLCDGIDDLATDRDIEEWARFLRMDNEWQAEIRCAVLNKVEPRNRYAD